MPTTKLCSALACSLAIALSASASADVKRGAAAPDFEARTLGGSTIKLSSLHGKVVLLDFWASWCEPCKKELPLLAKMASQLKPKGVEVITINIDEQAANAASFVKDHGLKLTVVLDSGQSIVKRYEPPKMPSSYAIDRAGVVRAVNEGFNDGDEAKIAQQLAAIAGD